MTDKSSQTYNPFLKKLSLIAGYQTGNFPVIDVLSDHVFLSKIDELEVLIIEHPKFEAAIALQGAHLLNWQPKGNHEVFWLSDKSAFKKNTAIRGGVPICWPWFGKVNTPSHGFARTSLWCIKSIEDNQNAVNLKFTLTENSHTKTLWPYAFNLELTINLSDQCEMILTTSGNFSYTGALHSYFNLSHIDKASVTGIGPLFIDSLAADKLKQGNKDDSENIIECLNIKNSDIDCNQIGFTQPIDRIYTQSEHTLVLNDSGFKRNVIIENHHHLVDGTSTPCDTVIWNPGEQLSQSMNDMSDDGYLTMGCIESAIITNPIHLTTHRYHTLKLNIKTTIHKS